MPTIKEAKQRGGGNKTIKKEKRVKKTGSSQIMAHVSRTIIMFKKTSNISNNGVILRDKHYSKMPE